MNQAEHKPSLSAYVLAFSAIYLIWGSTYLAIRVAVHSVPPFLMAGGRFLLAGTLMLGFLKLRGYAMPTKQQWRDNAVIGALLLCGGNGLVAWAEQSTPSSVIALGMGIQPALIVVTEWLWRGGQRPNLIVLIGIAIGFVGLAWLVAPWDHVHVAQVGSHGLIAMIVACVFWSIGLVYGRHVKNPVNLLVGAAAQMICGALVLLFVAVVLGETAKFDAALVSARSVWAIIYLIVIGSWAGYSAFVWLVRHSEPAHVATYAYVNPLVAIFLGWLILDEPVTMRIGVSAAIIIAAVIIVTTQKSRASA